MTLEEFNHILALEGEYVRSRYLHLAMRCRLESMLAANAERERRGEAQAYNWEALQEIGERAWKLAGKTGDMSQLI